MGRPHGRARVDSSNPEAFAVCDRCGFWYNHVDLQYQFKVAGPTTVNTNLLVCDRCLDDLQLNLMTITLPPDPAPIADPRIENFAIDEIDYLSPATGDVFVTEEDGDAIVTNQPSENFNG